MSVGFSTMKPGMATTARALLRAADRAVYQAKRDGRNRIVSKAPVFESEQSA